MRLRVDMPALEMRMLKRGSLNRVCVACDEGYTHGIIQYYKNGVIVSLSTRFNLLKSDTKSDTLNGAFQVRRVPVSWAKK